MPYQQINRLRYHYKRVGSGPPLLLLHGFTGSGQNWAGIVSGLADRFELILVDLLGHGQTDAPGLADRYRMEAAADDLAALCDRLSLPQVNLLGYSMGGRLALYFALRYPSRVARLILESASPGLADPTDRAERRTRDGALADRIEREGVPAFVSFWEGLSLWESQQALSAESRDRLRRLRLQNRSIGLANSLRGMGTGQQPSNWERLPELALPVCLLTGGLDQKFCRIGAEMAQQLPNAVHEILPEVGHTLHLEAPDAYVAAVRRFLLPA